MKIARERSPSVTGGPQVEMGHHQCNGKALIGKGRVQTASGRRESAGGCDTTGRLTSAARHSAILTALAVPRAAAGRRFAAPASASSPAVRLAHQTLAG